VRKENRDKTNTKGIEFTKVARRGKEEGLGGIGKAS